MNSYDIFKFVSLRAPEKPSEQRWKKRFAGYRKKTTFRREIESLDGRNVREKATAAAKAYIASDAYNPDATTVVEAVREASGAATFAAAKEQLEAKLDEEVEDFLAADRTEELRERLWDSVYAQALVPEQRPYDRDRLYEGVRAFHFLERVAEAEDGEAPPNAAELRRITVTAPSRRCSSRRSRTRWT